MSTSIFVFHRDEFNIKVLQAFVELHEFADLNLVQALRWVNSLFFFTWASFIELHIHVSHCGDLFVRKLIRSSARSYALLCKLAETALFYPSNCLCVCCLWRWKLLIISDKYRQLKHSRDSLLCLPYVDSWRSVLYLSTEMGKKQPNPYPKQINNYLCCRLLCPFLPPQLVPLDGEGGIPLAIISDYVQFLCKEVNFESSNFLLLSSVSHLSCERKCNILVYFFSFAVCVISLGCQHTVTLWSPVSSWWKSVIDLANSVDSGCSVATGDSLLTPEKLKCPCDLCLVRGLVTWSQNSFAMVEWCGDGHWSCLRLELRKPFLWEASYSCLFHPM